MSQSASFMYLNMHCGSCLRHTVVPPAPNIHMSVCVCVFVWYVLQDGKEADRCEGADAPALTQKVTQLAAATTTTTTQPTAAVSATNGSNGSAAVDVVSRIKSLLSGAPVVLFMKGSAESPYCGFSRKVVDALRGAGVQQLVDVDILKDEELR